MNRTTTPCPRKEAATVASIVDLADYRRRRAQVYRNDPLEWIRMRVRHEMDRRRLGLASLAGLSGLNPVSLARFLRGEPGSYPDAMRVARALHLPLSSMKELFLADRARSGP